jgi:glyoxylase-like metal-dependent hydrolase (beta-lactamase superfamily II)
VVLYSKEGNFVITGDVLFSGSIGRTDLPGGDYDVLIKSIHSELLSLPEGTVCYPGHGPATTIESERRNNPFLK